MAVKSVFLCACVAACCLPGAAGARSLKDCEKISAPLAYNECLSEFMPARRHPGVPTPKVDLSQVPMAYDPPAGITGIPPRRGAREARDTSSIIMMRGYNGRVSAEFEPHGSAPPRMRRIR